MVRGADYNSSYDEKAIYVASFYNLPQAKDWQVYGQVGHAKNFEGKDAVLTNAAVGVAKSLKAGGDRMSIFAEMGGEKYEERTRTTRRNIDVFGVGVGANYRF